MSRAVMLEPIGGIILNKQITTDGDIGLVELIDEANIKLIYENSIIYIAPITDNAPDNASYSWGHIAFTHWHKTIIEGSGYWQLALQSYGQRGRKPSESRNVQSSTPISVVHITDDGTIIIDGTSVSNTRWGNNTFNIYEIPIPNKFGIIGEKWITN